MMTSTIHVLPFATKADAVAEPVLLRTDLESRIKQRRVELIGRLRAIPSEASLEVVQTGDRLKARLSELAHVLSVVDGWADLDETVTHELLRWLAESERSLSNHDLSTKNGGS